MSLETDSSKVQPQDEYNAKYDALVARYEKAADQYGKLEMDVAKRKNKARQIELFIDQLRRAPLVLEEWDNQVWSLMVTKATVNRDRSLLFEFRNGKQIKVEAKQASAFLLAGRRTMRYNGLDKLEFVGQDFYYLRG